MAKKGLVVKGEGGVILPAVAFDNVLHGLVVLTLA